MEHNHYFIRFSAVSVESCLYLISQAVHDITVFNYPPTAVVLDMF
jgi:hypothetical protein